MYKVQIHKRVQKFLQFHSELLKPFAEKVKIIQIDPYSKFLDVKQMQGYNKNVYRLRIGKYRFLYEIFEEEILIDIFDADNRGDIAN